MSAVPLWRPRSAPPVNGPLLLPKGYEHTIISHSQEGDFVKKAIALLAIATLLFAVSSLWAQDDTATDESPSAQVEMSPDGDTTITTDNGAGVQTESNGDQPAEIDDSNGDAVGSVSVEPGDDAGASDTGD